MKKNVASQYIAANVTYAASGTPVVTSGAVLVYVCADTLAIQLGAVNSGICIPCSYGTHRYIPAQSETNFDHIVFTFVASGGVNQAVQLYTEFPQTGDAFARIGAPVGASLAVDVGSIQVGVNSGNTAQGSAATTLSSLHTRVSSVQTGADNVFTRIGAPVGASIAADIGTVVTQNSNNDVNVNSLHTRVASVAAQVSSVTVQVDSMYARIGAAGVGLTTLATSGNLDNVFTRIGAGGAALTTLATSGNLDNVFSRIGAPVGASIAADVTNFKGQLMTVVSGDSLNGTTTTICNTVNLTQTNTGHWAGAEIRFFTGSAAGQTRLVTDYSPGSSLLTFAPPLTAAVSGTTANFTLIHDARKDIHSVVGSVQTGGDLATALSSVQTGVNSANVALNSEAVTVSSLHTRVSSVQTGADNIFTRIGAPTGASVSVDVASVQAGVSANATNITSLHTRVTSVAVQVDSAYARIGEAGAGLTTLASSGNLTNVFNRIGAPVGASMSVDVSSIQTAVNTTLARLPAALTGTGNMKADMLAIQGVAGAATRLASHAATAVGVTFLNSGTPTLAILDQVDEAAASAVNDTYIGRVLIFTAPAALKDQATSISSYVGATKNATLVSVTNSVGATALAVMV